jgi:release factor glutamine methyltransferase
MENSIQILLTHISHILSSHSDTPSLDAQVLIAHILEKPRSWVLAHPEFIPDEQQYTKIMQSLRCLELGEPLPYIIGHWEFFSLDFQLTHDVLIPRPETELLVECGVSWLANHPGKRRAIDIGTGSGCIGISLAMHIPDLHILLTDISLRALIVARENAEKYGLTDRLNFLQADLLHGIVRQFDLMCANLPYIPDEILSKIPVAQSEPNLALAGGHKGTELIFNLLDQAKNILAPSGIILLEIEASQGAEVKSRVNSLYPATQVEVIKDLSGKDRCVEIIRSNLIVHLCQDNDWLEAREKGVFRSKSLDQQGFIHCSAPDQILQVANHFYKAIPGLVLLWVDPQKVISEIRWEATEGSFYPHVYGPINLEAVISVMDFKPDDDGIYRVVNPPV